MDGRRASARSRRTQASRSRTCAPTGPRRPASGGRTSCARSTRRFRSSTRLATRRGSRARSRSAGSYRFWGGEAAAALPDLERAAAARTRRGRPGRGGRKHPVHVCGDACRPDAGGGSAAATGGARLTRRDQREARDGVPRCMRAHLVATQGRLRRRTRLRFAGTSVGGGARPRRLPRTFRCRRRRAARRRRRGGRARAARGLRALRAGRGAGLSLEHRAATWSRRSSLRGATRRRCS